MSAAFSRERARPVILGLLGLLVLGFATVPVVQGVLHPPRCTSAAMLNAVLATQGVFLMLAARNPSAYRSFIMFVVWSSVAHATVMALMAIQVTAQRTELLVSAALGGLTAVLLLVLAPKY